MMTPGITPASWRFSALAISSLERDRSVFGTRRTVACVRLALPPWDAPEDAGQDEAIDGVSVVNVANGRSTRCTIVHKDGLARGELLLSQGRFQRIAELTSAPIHVQIRK